MTFTNRLGIIVPSMGSPLQNDTLYLKSGTALSGTVAQTTTMGSLSPTLRAGNIRIKFLGGGGTTPALVSVNITVTDGTTTYNIATINPPAAISLSATSGVDWLVEFLVDINVSSLSVVTTLSGTNPTTTMDIEVAGTTGNS